MNPFRSYVPGNLYVGTAGWSVPQASRGQFPATGTQLERYASVLKAVEINSSFHRSHMADTYNRWAESVADDFRFSVKLPKTITHAARLVDCDDHLHRFLGEVGGLGHKLGCLLVQLPPSLEFDPGVAENFFAMLTTAASAAVVVEPRHKTWFALNATRFLQSAGVSRVAADPAVVQAAGEPGGSARTVYFRLHGSPNVYSSPYTASYLDGLAFRLRKYSKTNAPVWCMFDNTIKGEAAANALYLDKRVALEEMGAGR
jgi:uncharacterized protein YecE (DUF72 family)